ncbi:ATP-binding cassette domain-containing protein [bacterium]|nr:ATP-binding cassette domain-containing protein [bacterium]
MTLPPILNIDNVVKRFNGFTAVDRISLTIPPKTIFGLLGPNGAGKTTLIRMITQITMPDEGRISFKGEKLNSMHSEDIGYLPEERGLYKQMKVGDHIIYLARLRGLTAADANKKVRAWFEKFEISNWWNKKIEELSKGMQQKVQFIATVAHEPELLIFDEPFTGLDPINADLIKDAIYQLKEKGATIIFSTHRMEQVEEICDAIVLVNKGKKILDGGVKLIKQQFKKNIYKVTFEGALPAIQHSDFNVIKSSGEELLIQTKPHNTPNELLTFLMDKIEIHSFQELLPTLNEIFKEQVTQDGHE